MLPSIEIIYTQINIVERMTIRYIQMLYYYITIVRIALVFFCTFGFLQNSILSRST
jgi:hypothetical protein